MKYDNFSVPNPSQDHGLKYKAQKLRKCAMLRNSKPIYLKWHTTVGCTLEFNWTLCFCLYTYCHRFTLQPQTRRICDFILLHWFTDSVAYYGLCMLIAQEKSNKNKNAQPPRIFCKVLSFDWSAFILNTKLNIFRVYVTFDYIFNQDYTTVAGDYQQFRIWFAMMNCK